MAQQQKHTREQLEREIEMAIADGIFTNNERECLKKSAIEAGLNAEQIIVEVETRLATFKGKAETELIDQNKRNGDDFEKYIVKRFNNKYYRVKEWAGDKYVEGIYASTTPQPDLIIELKPSYTTALFAVECKWRSKLNGNFLCIATTEQLKRYTNFGKKNNMPVFMAIGLGGEGSDPEEVFIMPIHKINTPFVHIANLKRFRKKSEYLFYDLKSMELR